ncbi:hypothetical protein HDIA_2036 [Hartmannibacter diazotrophicus]|uniref:Uncharacterized protein n=1 Tax=Hartmannibacter diazotrophicus TaxID=1482074 RepID=A0A2C9D5I4_9HYPH|nr:hypothetical protein HDIA_2036 [Hartmannibacter diazotrophicus]
MDQAFRLAETGARGHSEGCAGKSMPMAAVMNGV